MEIMIVEDHPVVAEGLQKLLKENNLSDNVPVISTGEECLKALELFRPEVIFLDINLPDISGIDLCKRITKKWPSVKIIALSSSGSRSVIEVMLENGARGYLMKDSDGEEIIYAISRVMAGEIYYNDHIRSILSARTNGDLPLLSSREKQVLKFIADGYTNNEIAEKMFISPLTVDSHRKNMLLKLGAKNTAALVKIAMVNGLIDN